MGPLCRTSRRLAPEAPIGHAAFLGPRRHCTGYVGRTTKAQPRRNNEREPRSGTSLRRLHLEYMLCVIKAISNNTPSQQPKEITTIFSQDQGFSARLENVPTRAVVIAKATPRMESSSAVRRLPHSPPYFWKLRSTTAMNITTPTTKARMYELENVTTRKQANDQLTDGGPPPTLGFPSGCAGPPFGEAPGSA